MAVKGDSIFLVKYSQKEASQRDASLKVATGSICLFEVYQRECGVRTHWNLAGESIELSGGL